ncbi:cysteine synthase A [Staphylococcus simulans]|uniref:cysteine synthase A n=1 Tax=Staphylococcus simulans TaxID=1286 RepID=UPI000D1F9FDE|nr:cysteine synthase A [Staphylococcus simulans]PTJ27100.1 cysteine synthase A [Staphylococcus simulans]
MANKPVDNIVQLIGDTPVVKLNNIVPEDAADVYVKLEYQNPGGSVKDRIALAMIERAEQEGKIKPGDTIVEPTSGNTGIGLAFVAAAKGYKAVFTMPETMSQERRNLLKAYGAEVVLTPGSEAMKGAIKKAKELKEEYGYYEPQQFENPANPLIHELATGPELVEQFEGRTIDAFLAGVGTGGTLSGVGKVLKEKYPSIQIVAIEPEGSPVLSGGEPGPHKLQGLGAGFVPDTLNTNIYDEVVKIGNETAMETSRRVAKEEGILAGISSGAAIYAAIEKAKELGKGKTVVTVLPSNGERYLSTPLYSFEGK